MNNLRLSLFLLISLATLSNGFAQKTTLVLDTAMFSAEQQINLATTQGWVYHTGHNPVWANPNLNTSGWHNRKPTELSLKDVDKTGRVEGWFRLRLTLDSTFNGMPVWFRKSTWSAVDLYVDGKLLASYGSTGTDGKPYQEYYFFNRLPTPVRLTPGREHLIALHVVDYKAPFSLTRIKSELDVPIDQSLRLVGPQYYAFIVDALTSTPFFNTLQFAAGLFSSLLLWLLVWQNVGDRSSLRLLAIQSSLTALNNFNGVISFINPSSLSFVRTRLADLLLFLVVSLLPVILLQMAKHPHVKRLTIFLVIVPLLAYSIDTVIGPIFITPITFALLVLFLLYVLISSWKKLYGAPRAIVVGIAIAFVFALLHVIAGGTVPPSLLRGTLLNSLGMAYNSTIPISFLVYVALQFKEILAEDRAKAATVTQITEEKRQLLATQNQLLEHQVEVRTAELKASQAQLIQKEKLASLGELTAGIAHEIQNPLNFVNNFSEVSAELVSELQEEEAKPDRDTELIQELLNDLSGNLQKINHHGGRASNIVKGMLEHSRTESGEKRPTNLNTLAEEYVKIAYHGLRAKDKNFNCELVTDFDPTLEPVEVAPQEIGRVLLNLYNNAFYAVSEKQKTAPATYQPTVRVSTQRSETGIEIRVKDNGTGISDVVKAKIFQPFFTTKPTGEGTGLGLSLSYDIITKGHGGTLTVASQEGEGSTFMIRLPSRK